ncbi:alkyl hydroperoxide reductase [Roseateles noduli]|nr:alkyl hydroperoxide reductase [Roseateles noduli]
MTSSLPVLHPTAPELQVVSWFNTEAELSLARLRGKVVALHAFQMLCPGCVAHGLPQAQRMHELFGAAGLQVIGLHTVFEHHQIMEQPEALAAFLHEYRLTFPVGADKPNGRVPATMSALKLQGTPSLLLIDRQGRVRLHEFGRVDDMAIGAAIGELLGEPLTAPIAAPRTRPLADLQAGCSEEGCRFTP